MCSLCGATITPGATRFRGVCSERCYRRTRRRAAGAAIDFTCEGCGIKGFRGPGTMQRYCAECRRLGRCRQCGARSKVGGFCNETCEARFRDQERTWKYNVPVGWYSEQCAKGCAICGTLNPGPKGFHVDHDHNCCPGRGESCGRCIRGVLCNSCNVAIGMMSDDPDRLRAAADYLSRVSVEGTVTLAVLR